MTAVEKLARRIADAPTLEAAQSIASSVLSGVRGKKQRAAAREPRAPGRMKPTREQKIAETSEIRKACVARAAGFGELCGKALDMKRAELCHLDGGNGNRTANQSVRNCVMEHHDCHQGSEGFDRMPLSWFGAVQAWAWRHGYEVPGKYQRLWALKDRPSAPVRVGVAHG